MHVPSLIRSLSHPSDTGRRRSISATVVNVLVAALVATAVDIVWPGVGSAVFLTAVAIVAVRGSLVPGAPRLYDTYRRYRASGDGEDFDAVAFLADAGALATPRDDLELDPAFAAAWRRRALEFGGRDTDHETLATTLGVDPAGVTLRWQETTWQETTLVARAHDQQVGRWPSRPAFVADVTAVAELERRSVQWRTLETSRQTQILRVLRLCLDTCPVCDGAVTIDDESAARSPAGLTMRCTGCNARLFESTHGATPLPSPADAGGPPAIPGPDETE